MIEQEQPPTILPPATITQAELDKHIKDLNVAQVIKDKEADIKDAQMHSIANERAAKEPLPSITQAAFTNDELIVPTSIGNVTIRKLKALDVTIFKITDSPFYKLFMGDIDENGSATEVFKRLFPDEELLFEVIYQFTHPIKDVYKLAKNNKQAYKDQIIEEIGFVYEPADILILVQAILGHIGIVNKARVELVAPQADEVDKKKQL